MPAILVAYGVWNGGVSSGPLFYALCAAAVALHLRHLGAQLAVRALLTLTFLAGLLNGARPVSVAAAALGLLALGRAGLGEDPRSTFTPRKGRAPLLMALVIGLMQVALLLWLAAWHAHPFHPRRVALDMACAAAVGAGVWGLWRLRVAGLLALPLAGAVVAALASLGPHRLCGVVVLPLGELCGFPFYGPHTATLMGSLAAAQIGCTTLVLWRALRRQPRP